MLHGEWGVCNSVESMGSGPGGIGDLKVLSTLVQLKDMRPKRCEEMNPGGLKADGGGETMGTGAMEGWEVCTLPEACRVQELFFSLLEVAI